MSLDTTLSDYEQIASNGKLAKYQRQVKNPTTQENENVTVYDIFEHGYIKVLKLTDIGWQVAEYDSKGTRVRSLKHGTYADTESEAHDRAKVWVKEAL